MELVERNPFSRVRCRGTLNRRTPMSDAEFQALMRHSPPYYRRLLVFLKFSGCRPGEAARIRWADVHFDFRPPTDHSAGADHGEVARLDQDPSAGFGAVAGGAISCRWSEKRFGNWPGSSGRMDAAITQPDSPVSPWAWSDAGGRHRCRRLLDLFAPGWLSAIGPFTRRAESPGPRFHDHDGSPLNKLNMNCFMARTRKRAGLRKGLCLYCLRHAFGLRGIRNGVSLKLLSLCMGHARTARLSTTSAMPG